MLSVSILGIKDNVLDNLKKLDSLGIDYFHIDIMDGKFVSNKTWKYRDIKKMFSSINGRRDVHLMVNNVGSYIRKFSKLNPDIITFHYEATSKYFKYINYLKKRGIKVGIAIKPDTNVNVLSSLFDYIDLVLVMSVEPGKGGQKYIENSTNKINELKLLREKNGYHYLIEVDGGINNLTKNDASNADILVVGSYITNNDYEEKIKEFE